MPQLRQNPITGDWVVIAPERARRPTDYVVTDGRLKAPHTKCDFCIGEKAYQDQIKEFETEQIYVVRNKYPAFVEDSSVCSVKTSSIENNFYRARPSTGGHDIVVIKDPNVNLLTFNQVIWQELLESFQKRSTYFKTICNVEATMPIYNYKSAAGASVEHPHAQIFATNTVPNQIAREVHSSYAYYEKNGTCVFCDMVKHEQKNNERIIVADDTFVAFTFYAARFPFEVWVVPKQHQDRFEITLPEIINKLAGLLPKLFNLYNTRLNDPPLNFYIHSLPNSLDKADFYHWHLEITPRLSNYGGFELGSGMIIDIVSPEKAARFLRN